jgi:transcriptional regulator of acetoin/glycerol metabolism
LQEHSWPGNVRELQHAIERAVILSDKDHLKPEDFNTDIPQTSFKQIQAGEELHSLDEMEKKAVVHALKKSGGNISQAAQELGLSRAALYRRMEKHGL